MMVLQKYYAKEVRIFIFYYDNNSLLDVLYDFLKKFF